MTTRDLLFRGFQKHTGLSSFYGYCPQCGDYQSIAWWETPAPCVHHVAACEKCQTVDHRDADWVRPRYPITKARAA